MAVLIASLILLFLAMMTGHSDASYCLCNSGVNDTQLQKDIDYACGNGADCTQIQSTAPCYNPNTVKDHCNYAVNSYYQRKGQVPGSCDFSSTAAVSQTAPTTSSGCVYPSSSSNAGTSPSTNPSTSPTTTNPSTSPTTTTPSGTTTTPVFGVGPSANGVTNPDNNAGRVTFHHNLLTPLAATLVFSGLISLRV
ncbi:hypothetical protein ACH5RR_030455 [Cinchona calisaya]|uniref:X8 domain-containing protein n=1 Tax=Cinchona calisaya TaxID=153742 RepID=A0ABD2YW09_9GENT